MYVLVGVQSAAWSCWFCSTTIVWLLKNLVFFKALKLSKKEDSPPSSQHQTTSYVLVKYVSIDYFTYIKNQPYYIGKRFDIFPHHNERSSLVTKLNRSFPFAWILLLIYLSTSHLRFHDAFLNHGPASKPLLNVPCLAVLPIVSMSPEDPPCDGSLHFYDLHFP